MIPLQKDWSLHWISLAKGRKEEQFLDEGLRTEKHGDEQSEPHLEAESNLSIV